MTANEHDSNHGMIITDYFHLSLLLMIITYHLSLLFVTADEHDSNHEPGPLAHGRVALHLPLRSGAAKSPVTLKKRPRAAAKSPARGTRALLKSPAKEPC